MTNYGKESLMRFKKQEITGLLQHLHFSTTCFENFLFISSFLFLTRRVFIDYVLLLRLPSAEIVLLYAGMESEQEDNNEKFLSYYDER